MQNKNKYRTDRIAIMKYLLLTLILCFIVIESESICWPWQGTGVINVCKNIDQTNCIGVSSGNTCINLIGGAFVSGFASGQYTCSIFKKAGCAGSQFLVHNKMNDPFPWDAESIRCPCL